MPVWLQTTPILPFVQGFMLCAGLLIVFGPQNLFLLRQGLRKDNLFVTALTCTLVDLLLISLGVGGLGSVISTNQPVLWITTIGGAAFLLGYGVRSLRCAWVGCSATHHANADTLSYSLQGSVLAALSFSLLNPAAYVDTLLMIGATSGRYPFDQRILFGCGAVTASCLWFFALTYGAGRLTPLFRHPAAWRTLDVVSGCIMLGLATSLSASHSTLFW